MLIRMDKLKKTLLVQLPITKKLQSVVKPKKLEKKEDIEKTLLAKKDVKPIKSQSLLLK